MLVAGLALAAPAIVRTAAASQLPLLAAGCALLLAGLAILRPATLRFLNAQVMVTDVAVFAVLGGTAYALTQLFQPSRVLPATYVVALVAVALASPNNPLTAWSALAAILLGNMSGSGWHWPAITVVLPCFAAACLLSYGAVRARSMQRVYSAARLSLEQEMKRLQEYKEQVLDRGEVALAVRAAADAFASAREPEEICKQIATHTGAQLRAAGCLLLVWDATHETLRVGAVSGPQVASATDPHTIDVPPSSLPTLRESAPGSIVTVAPNGFREPLFRSLFQRWKAARIYGVRIEWDERLLGLLFICRTEASAVLTAREREVLTGIAPHAAAALAHANLLSELRAAEKLKAEFMATMSHELRTPLNVIIGYTDLQLDGFFGELGDEHRQAVERTREQALQLLDLIQATLDMGRLERGLMSVDLRDVSLVEFLEHLQTQIPRSWRRPTVELNWRVAPGLPSVRTDPHKLRVILRNLIHNALKFTQHGVVNVTVTARPGGDEVTFVVQDTGIGIRAEHLSQVFEMFRQIPQPDHMPGGVGLGLYIVHRFAHVLGARIDLSSAPGRGTTFRVHLPTAGPFVSLQRSRGEEVGRAAPL